MSFGIPVRNGLGIGLLASTSLATRNRSFSPALLFAANEPGGWYDPSDLSTMFQDSAGTTPVTATGQTVGRILDKSGRGNHLTQATLANRPIYGIEPLGGRRNLLTYTEQFDNAAWVKTSANVVANSTAAPDGSATADTLRLNAGTALTTSVFGLYTSATPYVSQATVSALSAGAYTYSLYVYGGVGLSHVQLRVSRTSASLNPASATTIVRLSDGAVVDGTGVVTSAGGGWWRVSLPFTATAAVHYVGIWFWNSAAISSATGTEGIYVWGAQLETGSTATAYQRVTDQWNVTEAGKPSLSYLQYDGSDDFFVSPTITPGIDKAQVFAGVRKLSDAAAVLAELSANRNLNNGAFTVSAPAGIAPNQGYGFVSKGTSDSLAEASSGYASPITNVITGIGDIAADTAILRINGTQVASSAADQGTGNYLAYPMYVGRRAGTALPFNGRIYSLIVRFGANLTTEQIAQTEAWVNSKTGAY